MFELKIYPVLGIVLGINYYEQETLQDDSDLSVLQMFIFLIQIDILWEREKLNTDGV